MLIPLTHERATVQRLPWVTIAVIALNVIVFASTWPRAQRDTARSNEARRELLDFATGHPGIWEDDCGRCPGRTDFEKLRERYEDAQAEHIFSRFGFVPGKPTLRGLVGSLFLHAGWSHLLWNMYFLWLYGCSIEDLWGRPLYAAVYLTGGGVAALAHGAYQPESLAPLVGASGAIAALTGVFFVRCYDTRIRFFWTFLILFGTFYAPASIMLGLWFTKELFYAFVFQGSSSVAFWAHIGGFGFGVLVALAVKLARIEERFIAPSIDRKTNLVARHPRAREAIALIERGAYEEALGPLRVAARESPDDPELCRFLAQCYQALERPADAAPWLRKELRIHASRGDDELEAETYQELVATALDVRLTSRELASAARALMATGNEDLGAPIFRELLENAPEPAVRLRSALALADFYAHEGDRSRAESALAQAAALSEILPEWRSLVMERRRALERRPGSRDRRGITRAGGRR